MPTIPTQTARVARGELSTRPVSPDAYGAEGWKGLSENGRIVQGIVDKMQAVRDQLDLAKLASDYKVWLDGVTQSVAQETDLTKQPGQFKTQTQDLKATLYENNPDVRRPVKAAFESHAMGADATAFLEARHAAVKTKAQRAIADFHDTEQHLTTRAAMATDPNQAVQDITLTNELRANMVKSGLLNPKEAQAGQAVAQDRYWTIVAQQRPEAVLDMVNHPPEGGLRGGDSVAGMDPEKQNVYVNLAISTLHARQFGEAAAQKAADNAFKEMQENNLAELRATVMEGKPLPPSLGQLVRDRQIDGDKLPGIYELQAKLMQVPDMAKYQRGLSTRIETELSHIKYDNKPFNRTLADGLQSDFVQGHLLKEEFTHLMGVLRAVEDYKLQEDKTGRNQDIAHARDVLDRKLRVVGPTGTYLKPISEQTIAEANEFYYRRIERFPNENPWDVMQKAIDHFRPGVEKEIGLTDAEKWKLEDARVNGQMENKLISPAAHSSYHGKAQADRGWAAVQKTLKELPPPPAPSFLERLKKTFSGKDETRKEPGVMGR